MGTKSLRHPNTYPWHESDLSAHFVAPGPGVLVPPSYFESSLRKDEAHPHTAAHGKAPDFSGGQEIKGNAQVATTGSSKAYGRFAAPYGSVTPGSPSTLKYYPLEGKADAATAQVAHHGYSHYYAGGSYGRPDLANRNYVTKHLMIYDPTPGSGGDSGEQSYTDAWRKTHELGHALTLDQLNQKYGEGRRIGALGKQRTAREAKRAVEWEWLAAHKQRELASRLGVNISDDDFHRELNTVMHDAVHRAVTGKFTDPQSEGFRPYSHKVPLETALGLVDTAAQELGLRHDHDLLSKSVDTACIDSAVHNLTVTTGSNSDMSDQVTRKDITAGLAKALRSALANAETIIAAADKAEAAGQKLAKNAMSGYGPSSPGVGSQVPPNPAMAKDDVIPEPAIKEEMDKCGEMTTVKKDEMGQQSCPACGGPGIVFLGSLGNRDHSVCRGCGMEFSTPREENALAQEQAVEKKTPPDISEKTMHKLKDEYKGDKSKAYATAWSIHNKMDKKEIKTGTVDEKSAPGAKLPATSAEVKAPGSGGDIKKGKKLQKDAHPMDVALGMAKPAAKMSAPKLPGMAYGPGQAPVGTHPEVDAAIKALKPKAGPAGPAAVAPTAPANVVGKGGKPLPFVKKPAADDPVQAPISGAEKRAAGIGFLSSLISKFKGIGSKTWGDLAGAGPASAGRAAKTMGTRMAMGEDDKFKKDALGMPKPPKPPAMGKPVAKTDLAAANKEIAGFKSLVPKTPKPGTSVAGVNQELKGFKSLASNPTAMPGTQGPKK